MSSHSFARLVMAVLVLFSSGNTASYAQGSMYNEALQLFQKEQYAEAKQKFEAALSDQGPNPYVFHNLAMTELKLGNGGVALGFWRRALDMDPGFKPAREAVSHTIESLKIKELPHKITGWETLRQSLLTRFSLSSHLAVTAILLFLSGWFGLTYLGRRHRAKKGEERTPKFPTLASLLFVLFATSLGTSVAKIVDMEESRGTIVVPKAEAKASPGIDQATLFDLFEGIEVIVRQSIELENNESWTQVTYPGGMTGWVKTEMVMLSSGRGAW